MRYRHPPELAEILRWQAFALRMPALPQDDILVGDILVEGRLAPCWCRMRARRGDLTRDVRRGIGGRSWGPRGPCRPDGC